MILSVAYIKEFMKLEECEVPGGSSIFSKLIFNYNWASEFLFITIILMLVISLL